MPFHFMVKFDPPSSAVDAFREELLGVIGPSLQEPGCIRMEVFESVNQPFLFYIHSEWIDQAAFDLHATLPHTLRFVSAAERLLGHPIRGARLRRIGGGDLR